MDHRRVGLSTVLAVAASMSGIVAPADAEPRGVVELFTSQGCSSCPPADQVLGDLSRDPSVVALSLPIDYWDYLGWKDTLANPQHSARQRGYAHQRGDREVYTPQAVINGAVHVLGSDKVAIERALTLSRHDATLSLPVKLTQSNGELDVTVQPGSTAGPSGEVWLCALSRSVPVQIRRGENNGHTVAYHNVVRHWIKLGEWTGQVRTYRIPVADIETDGIDAVAVIVQGGTPENPRAMLGAALESVR